MADRDKVIKGLEACSHSECHAEDCPYNGIGCSTRLAKDALELLKAQEPTAAEEPAKRCGSCKWLRDPEFTRVCVNGDSPNVADFMDMDDSCECWEAKEDAGK